MSAAYCCIAIVMSATVHPGPDVNYNPAAVPRSPVERIMGIFNAMATVFFSYGGHNVALEIQATIPSNAKTPNMHTSTVPAMMRGVNVTFLITGAAHDAVARASTYAWPALSDCFAQQLPLSRLTSCTRAWKSGAQMFCCP
jgi:hypothetical protein